jgi:CRISPR-associated protein Cas1
LENCGFSPYVGFIHQTHRNHPSLASDLMKEWRAIVVDSAVMSLIQGNEIKITQCDKIGRLVQPDDHVKIYIKGGFCK